MVANEINAAYAGKLALVDLEDEIDTVLRKLNDLWFDGCSEPSVPTIKVEDPFDIVLDSRPSVDDARPQLDLGIEILVVELLIALKGNAIDDRVLDYFDDQSIADAAQIDIGKQAGRKQRLERLVHTFIVPRVAGLDQQIGANRFRFDPLHPLNADIADRPPAHLRHGRSTSGSLRRHRWHDSRRNTSYRDHCPR